MDEAICTDDDCPDHSAAADHCTTAIKVTSAMSRMHVVIARHHMHFGCGAAARRPSFSSTARMGRQRSGKRRRATAGFGPLRLMVPPSHLQRGPATHACGRLIRDVMHAWTYAACVVYWSVILWAHARLTPSAIGVPWPLDSWTWWCSTR